MKKILIAFSMAFYAFAGYSQLLKPVQLDSLVTVSLPVGFKKAATKGDQTYSGQASFGFVIVTRTENPPANKVLKKEGDLNNVFKAYVEQLKQSSEGTTILNDHDTIVQNLEVRDFTLRTDTGDGPQYRKFRLLYTKPITYTFDYSYQEASQEVGKKEMDAFFNSIKVSPQLDGTDQFVMYGRHTGLGTPVVIAIVVGGVGLLILLVVVLRKKKELAA